MTKRSVSRCCTRKEILSPSQPHVMKHASEGIHPGFEAQAIPRQKFKTEVSLVTQKLILMSSKNIFKKKDATEIEI